MASAELTHPYGDLEAFFPATDPGFVRHAGRVKTLKSTDFEDIHRRRHLDSFANSMNEWAQFPNRRNKNLPNSSNETTEDTESKPPHPQLKSFVMELHQILSEAASEANSQEQLNDVDTNKKGHTGSCSLNSSANADKIKISSFEQSSTYSEFTLSASSINTLLNQLRKKYHISPSKSDILSAYNHLVLSKKLPPSDHLTHLIRKKAVRSNSGVCVITVLTSPGEFSCPKDCHYCPNEPGQPRSYLSTEPAVLRANQNGWDAFDQFFDRANNLKKNGHVIDKIEILVLGGTWSGYPAEYQYMFIRDLFYSANVYSDTPPYRQRLSLEEEQTINENAKSRIIGLTLETRPDYISRHEIQKLRNYGCTRVQIGVQHTDEEILKVINRGCTTQQCIKAIKMLKDAAFKVDIHLMPDLPTSSPEKDLEMFDWVLSSPSLQVDQWKIYPCEVTPFSKIEEWYKDGLFTPYTELDSEILIDLLISVKSSVHPWIRLNRVIRDIPNQSIIAGNDKTNLRQLVLQRMGAMNLACKCIRCREVKDQRMDISKSAILKVRHYLTDGGDEYFLSFETQDEKTIFGFLRLRLPHKSPDPFKLPFPVLENAALLRELHVYGIVVAHDEKKPEHDIRPQHRGIGNKLILAAELFAYLKGFKKMVVIAGIGTRGYYKKFGYVTQQTYCTKDLSSYISQDMDIPHQIEKMTIQHIDTSLVKASNTQNYFPPIEHPKEVIDLKEAIRNIPLTSVEKPNLYNNDKLFLYLAIGSYLLFRIFKMF